MLRSITHTKIRDFAHGNLPRQMHHHQWQVPVNCVRRSYIGQHRTDYWTLLEPSSCHEWCLPSPLGEPPIYKREEKKKDLSTRIHGRVIKALSLGSKALEFGSCVKNWYPQHGGAGCSVFFLEKPKISLLNKRYTSIISEVKPVWTKATRGTLDQEFKTLNYAYYTQLVRMVKILRCRRPEDQA